MLSLILLPFLCQDRRWEACSGAWSLQTSLAVAYSYQVPGRSWFLLTQKEHRPLEAESKARTTSLLPRSPGISVP